MTASGQDPGGAGEVVRDGDAGQPGVGGESAGGQVGQGSVDEFGEDLLDDGVAAVLGPRLHEDERAVGERGMAAPDGEQLALAVDVGLVEVGTRRTISRAVISSRVAPNAV
jgi:hypothetical protein